MRKGAMLDFVLTNEEGLVSNVKLKGSLGCSDHEMVEFKILRVSKRVHSKLATLDLRRADFTLYRRIPRDTALERRDRVPGHKGYVKAEGTQCFLCLSFYW